MVAKSPSPASLPVAEWLGCFRRIADRQRRALFSAGVEHDVRPEGIGAGGDVTLSLDRVAEQIVFDELEKLAAGRVALTVVSEERGRTLIGEGEVAATLVIDPLDGSNNAARGIGPHALSIAVANGDRFRDVTLAYVKDLRGGDEIVAAIGQPALLNDLRPRPSVPLVSPMIGLEYGTEALLEAASHALPCATVRIVGSSAVALANVGVGRFDGFVTGWGSRCVDIAASAFIAGAGGASVAIRRCDESTGDFDLASRFQVTAARDPALLETLLGLAGGGPARLIQPTT